MKKHTSTLRKRLLYCDTPHALAIYWMLIVFHSRRSLYLKLQNRRFYPSFSEINFNRSILTSPQARCRECSTTTKWGYKRCKRSTLEFMTFPTDQSLRIPAAFYSLQKNTHTHWKQLLLDALEMFHLNFHPRNLGSRCNVFAVHLLFNNYNHLLLLNINFYFTHPSCPLPTLELGWGNFLP